MERILFSTYLLKIKDKRGNDQLLERFNGNDDFFEVFISYLNDIFRNIVALTDTTGANTIHFTLETPPVIDRTRRVIYGYFSSGLGGEEYPIKDIEENRVVYNVQRNQAAFRTIFYYISMPRGRLSGSIILQRRSKFGIKGVFKNTLSRYFTEHGYQLNKIHVNNILHSQVYHRMITDGNLKRVDFIRRRIPTTIEGLFLNNGNPDTIPGTLKTSLLSATSLPMAMRLYVDRLFRRNNVRIELDGIDEDFDEIEFELELNGKKKSFYIANRNRIQPDIDVTNQLIYEDLIPTLASLVAQAEEMVQDLVEMHANI